MRIFGLTIEKTSTRGKAIEVLMNRVDIWRRIAMKRSKQLRAVLREGAAKTEAK